MNYKNIIFDIGNVVVKFQPKDYLIEKFAQRETETFLYNNFFNTQEWQQLDKGVLESEQADEIFMARAKKAGYSFEMQAVIDDWCDMLTPIKETCVLIMQLRQMGYDIYYLSNISQRGLEYLYKKTTLMSMFVGGVASCEVKCLKPDVEIYKALITKYNLDPNVSVYVDDMGGNIPPAYRLGMHSFQFTNVDMLKSKLTREGVVQFEGKKHR